MKNIINSIYRTLGRVLFIYQHYSILFDTFRARVSRIFNFDEHLLKDIDEHALKLLTDKLDFSYYT